MKGRITVACLPFHLAISFFVFKDALTKTVGIAGRTVRPRQLGFPASQDVQDDSPKAVRHFSTRPNVVSGARVVSGGRRRDAVLSEPRRRLALLVKPTFRFVTLLPGNRRPS